MNKPPFRAAKFCPAAAGAALFLLPHTALGQTSDITCTAAPDCASLGYTKSVDQCPDGGMKCPFDSSKMFCVSAGNMDFVFKNPIAVGHIVYSDGTTSASYNSKKLPIGIVVYVHHSPQKNHGLILAIDAPMPRTRAEAILYCDSYVTKGTQVGDWHLPDAGEAWMYTNANPDYALSSFNNFLANIVGGDTLEMKFSNFFGYNSSYINYCNKHSYVSGNCSTPRNTSYYPWTSTDNYSTPTNQILPQLNHNFSYYNSNYSSYFNNFRCVAEF